jgi:hypothetical protein
MITNFINIDKIKYISVYENNGLYKVVISLDSGDVIKTIFENFPEYDFFRKKYLLNFMIV